MAFADKNVARDPSVLNEMLERTGGRRGVPVIVVGDEVMLGFDRGGLARLLGIGAPRS